MSCQYLALRSRLGAFFDAQNTIHKEENKMTKTTLSFQLSDGRIVERECMLSDGFAQALEEKRNEQTEEKTSELQAEVILF